MKYCMQLKKIKTKVPTIEQKLDYYQGVRLVVIDVFSFFVFLNHNR